MREAILAVSFGTSHRDARENSLERICEELSGAGKGLPVYQAYTSGMIIGKLLKEGVRIAAVEEAILKLSEQGITRLYVIPTHMIPGSEYNKLLRLLAPYRDSFESMGIAAPVLDREADCAKLVPVLDGILHFSPEREYILMGHGTEDAANVRYAQMNEAFMRAGFDNVRIASVEAKPDLSDALDELKRRGTQKKVLLHPFMVVAGDHAKNDMAGEEDSYLTALRDAGYQPEAVVKGLGEYPQFRELYADRLRALMKQAAERPGENRRKI